MRDGTPHTKMNDATVQREEAVETKDKYVASGRTDHKSATNSRERLWVRVWRIRGGGQVHGET